MYLIPVQLWRLILSFQKCDFWLSGLKYSIHGMSSSTWYGLWKKLKLGIHPQRTFLLLLEILWSVRRANGAGCSVLILFTLGLHSNQEEESMWITNVMRILWLHKNLSTKDTCPVRHLHSFNFFHKHYQVLELILCTEYLSPEGQKFQF